MYMWAGVGDGLIDRSSFGQDPPQFFRDKKDENFTMTPLGNICFVFLIPRNPPMEIGKIIGIYVSQVVLTKARLGFGVPPYFIVGKNVNFG